MNLRKLWRVLLFYLMTIFGTLTMITGLILYFWPRGPRAGRLEIFGYTKDFWKDLHMYIAIVAVVIIIFHVIENRRAVKHYVKETIGR